MPLSEDDRRCARLKFSRSVRFLSHVEMYYVPSIRGVISRSVGSRLEFRLPRDAVHIGTYRDLDSRNAGEPLGALVEQFLGDLDDVIAKLDAARRTAAA